MQRNSYCPTVTGLKGRCTKALEKTVGTDTSSPVLPFTIEILCKDTKIILNKRQKSLKNIVYGTESKRSRTSIHTGAGRQ